MKTISQIPEEVPFAGKIYQTFESTSQTNFESELSLIDQVV